MPGATSVYRISRYGASPHRMAGWLYCRQGAWAPPRMARVVGYTTREGERFRTGADANDGERSGDMAARDGSHGSHDALVEEQITYYRARANEYDEWFLRQGRYDHGAEANARWHAEVAEVAGALDGFLRERPIASALEIAAGTGLWTQRLAPAVQRLTALDATSPCQRARHPVRPLRQGEGDPNGIVDKALDGLRGSSPRPLATQDRSATSTPNFDADLAPLADYDLIIEAIAERGGLERRPLRPGRAASSRRTRSSRPTPRGSR